VAREAVAAAEQANDLRLLADALKRLGLSLKDRQPKESAEHFNRALEYSRTTGDRYGEAQCYLNLGLIHQHAGELSPAQAAWERSLEAAKSAHALDLAGIAALDLGVLHQRRGRPELAGERFEEALSAFTEAANELHRMVALYNMADLARETGDCAMASSLYDQVTSIAARIGQRDVELGARAGQALAALAVGQRGIAEDAMQWIRANVDTRKDWWFQGRELVDALGIRLAAERGDEAHALRLLQDAVELSRQQDPYIAAYIIAECASSLPRSAEVLIALIDGVRPGMSDLGFAPMAERLGNIRMSLVGTTLAA
jgi:tetratricopeptide (TPR) repeat protein